MGRSFMNIYKWWIFPHALEGNGKICFISRYSPVKVKTMLNRDFPEKRIYKSKLHTQFHKTWRCHDLNLWRFPYALVSRKYMNPP